MSSMPARSRGARRNALTAAVVSIALLGLPGEVVAQTSPPPACLGERPPGWCANFVPPGQDGHGGPGAGDPATPVADVRYYPRYIVVLDTEPGTGEYCWRLEIFAWSTDPPSENLTREGAQAILDSYTSRIVIDYVGEADIDADACTNQAPAVDIRQLAQEVWLLLQPPEFEPWIAPGRALAGLPAYLELAGQDTATEQLTLPDGLGQLRIDAFVVEHVVDFDTTDPSSSPVVATGTGAPWDGDPTAQISHTYTTSGDRIVSVTTRWGATFTAPGQSGELGIRERTVELPISVTEYRAVRTTDR
jgi:hypothetical protein